MEKTLQKQIYSLEKELACINLLLYEYTLLDSMLNRRDKSPISNQEYLRMFSRFVHLSKTREERIERLLLYSYVSIFLFEKEKLCYDQVFLYLEQRKKDLKQQIQKEMNMKNESMRTILLTLTRKPIDK